MSKEKTLAELTALAETWRARGEKAVLANGAFDLLHVGHLRYLQGAKALGDVLVVAVNSDASVRQAKGENRPVVPQAERAELLCALSCVDFVTVFDEDDVRHIIAALKPAVHAKGTDYTPDSVPERAEVEKYGGRVAITGDPKDHSTTETVAQLTKRGLPLTK